MVGRRNDGKDGRRVVRGERCVEGVEKWMWIGRIGGIGDGEEKDDDEREAKFQVNG
jgi:hypothetical protein